MEFLYGAVLTLLGTSYSILSWHIQRNGLFTNPDGVAQSQWTVRRNLLGSFVYPTARVISLRYPRVSVAIYFLLAAFYFVPSGQQSKP